MLSPLYQDEKSCELYKQNVKKIPEINFISRKLKKFENTHNLELLKEFLAKSAELIEIQEKYAKHTYKPK